MRHPISRALPAAVLAAVIAAPLAVTPAAAQVSVNPGALDLLPTAPARKPPASRNAAPTKRPAHTAEKPEVAKTPQKAPEKAPEKQGTALSRPPAPVANPNAPAGPAAVIAKPSLPTIPPAIAALPPPAPVPAPRPQPAPVVPLVADAKGSATPISGGVRVTFGADSSDLNPSTSAALRDFAAKMKPQDTTSIAIDAYAAGTPDDASTARRLSLARALAARAVLINAGIPSTRIYPRALGAAGGDGGPDRVDVIAGSAAPPPSATPARLPPTTIPAPSADQKAPAK